MEFGLAPVQSHDNFDAMRAQATLNRIVCVVDSAAKRNEAEAFYGRALLGEKIMPWSVVSILIIKTCLVKQVRRNERVHYDD
jgi:hypothetical protein